MLKDKKKAAMLIVSKVAKPEKQPEQDLKDSVAEEIFSAVEAKDASKFKSSMKSYVQMCLDESDSSAKEE